MLQFKVCHFTSVHPASDARILLKECSSLSGAGYRVFLVATKCLSQIINGVHIVPVTSYGRGRLIRMILTAWSTYREALLLDADIYHFHDPELIPYGLLLKLHKKVVIYDAHENVPDDILVKEWIPFVLRKSISIAFRYFEDWSGRRMDAVICATPTIATRFLKSGCRAVCVNNYPIVNELGVENYIGFGDEAIVCFVGGLNYIRGAEQMIRAVEIANCKLFLAGEFSPPSYRMDVSGLRGWSNVVEYGQVSRGEVAAIFEKSLAGLVLYHPGPNHTDSQPNKLFEYMSAGLPVIASNFPLWVEIVEGNNCGICVDPLNVGAIADAIRRLINNPEEARVMGENGRMAVENRYNWNNEFQKLQTLYEELV